MPEKNSQPKKSEFNKPDLDGMLIKFPPAPTVLFVLSPCAFRSLKAKFDNFYGVEIMLKSGQQQPAFAFSSRHQAACYIAGLISEARLLECVRLMRRRSAKHLEKQMRL